MKEVIINAEEENTTDADAQTKGQRRKGLLARESSSGGRGAAAGCTTPGLAL